MLIARGVTEMWGIKRPEALEATVATFVTRNTAFPLNLMLSQIAALAKICGFNHLMFFKINRQLQNARS